MSPRKKQPTSEKKASPPSPPENEVAGREVCPPSEEDRAEAVSAAVASIGRAVIFRLADQRWALPIEKVQEIQQIVAFTEVPDPSAAMLGMIDLRGRVVPALDARLLLGIEAHPFTLQTPMIFCRARGLLVALVVDEVEDVVSVPDDCLQPPSRMHALADRMLGVCRLDDGLVFILNADTLIPAEVIDIAAGGEGA